MFSYSNTTLWKRDRNFFKDKLVYFKSNGPIILSIEFFLKKMGTTHGLIKLSHDHLGKVKPWFIEALQDNSGLFLDKANPNYIEFKFERGVAQKVIAVFKKINHDYCRLECSNILLEEIKQLEHFICNLAVPKKHILKDKYTSPNIHPSRKNSKELVTFLAKFDLGDPLVNDGIPKDEIKRYLKDGEDPNQYNGALLTPLDMLFVRRDLTEKPFKRCMLLLLAYHVSLGRVIWGRNSTLEGWGRSLYYPQKTGWVQELLVRVYKQPKSAIAPMRIESNATSSKLITAIIKNNKFIHTILRKTTPTDAFIRDNKLFDLFSVSFEANPNGKKTLEEIYRKDFSGDNKYVDIIYHHHTIIGFSLYELVRLEAYPNHLFLHWIDAVIEKDYRQEGLITLLVFRTALLLQILHPDLIIGLFCVSITANSGTLFNNLHLLYHPQYGDHDIIVQSLIQKTIGKVPYFRNNAACYIPQDTRVKNSSSLADNEALMKVFYREEMLVEDKDNPYKGVPIYLPVGNQIYKHLIQSYSGLFDFREDINRLGNAALKAGFRLSLDNKKSQAQPGELYKTRDLFWCSQLKKTKNILTKGEKKPACAL